MLRRLTIVCALLLIVPTIAHAHCEIPCGIYGDSMRIEMMLEHVTTIEKSMNQVTALSSEGEKNYNQIVRWVSNKEAHAEELQHIVSQYFLHQRIKPAGVNDASYVKQLTLLHEILVAAMKSKQTTDLQFVETLRARIRDFSEAYFGPEDLEHLREHGLGQGE